MHEQITDRARKVFQLANQEAQRFNHEYIGPEHILLGLVKVGSSVALNVFQDFDVDPKKLRLDVEKIVQSGPEMITMGKLPQTAKAQNVFRAAFDEQAAMAHSYVGTEHILLGLLTVEGSVAIDVLVKNGIELQQAREVVLKLLAADPDLAESQTWNENTPSGKRLTAQQKKKRQKEKRKELSAQRRARRKGKRSQPAETSTEFDKLCEQINQLSSAERMEVLQLLWIDGGKISEQTPRLAIEVLSCQRNSGVIQIEVEVTNVSLVPIVVSGFKYHFPSLIGEGSIYCLCQPGQSKELAFGIQAGSEDEATVSLTGFNPLLGLPDDGGSVIHGFVAKVDD